MGPAAAGAVGFGAPVAVPVGFGGPSAAGQDASLAAAPEGAHSHMPMSCDGHKRWSILGLGCSLCINLLEECCNRDVSLYSCCRCGSKEGEAVSSTGCKC